MKIGGSRQGPDSHCIDPFRGLAPTATVGSPRWGSFLSTRYHRPAHRTGGRYYFTYKTGDLESYPKDFFFRRKEIKRY